jgi:hypothetical protein
MANNSLLLVHDYHEYGTLLVTTLEVR